MLELIKASLRTPDILRAIRSSGDQSASGLFQLAAASHIFPPLQLESEFVRFYELARAAKPSTILEIGTCRGGTLFLLARLLAPKGHLLSIDLPNGPFGGGFPIWKIPLFHSFMKADQTLTLLRTDSHLPQTGRMVEKVLAGLSLDLLFIDGDHSYDGVRNDFEMYSRFLRPGGMIVFHDIVEGHMAGGVNRFWNEMKIDHRHCEFVQDWAQGSCGLGVLWMDKKGATR